jgi:hypothetical protein
LNTSAPNIRAFEVSIKPGQLHPWAAEVVANVMDVLRIVHGGDIGVGALRVVPRSRHTPHIRRTYAWDYEPEVTPYLARRTAYGLPPAESLAPSEVDDIRRLLPKHLLGVQQKGLGVALQRFRDSYERHSPEDPQRLLDVAIAFEALLLNDGPDKELSYRLRLRGARWLHGAPEARRATFQLLRDLYGVRSQIAHGETLASLGLADRRRLAAVLRDAPVLLRQALRHSLEGRGPEGLEGEALQAWWRGIELG